MPDKGRHVDGNVAMMTILAQAFPCGELEMPAG
jgi:hypothetical protein